jgi:hypothetical protein
MFSLCNSHVSGIILQNGFTGGHRLMAPVKVNSYAINTEKNNPQNETLFCHTKMAQRGL